MANGGDGYPMKANGENFRFLLQDPVTGVITLGAAVDEALNFTATGVVPANAVGEQIAFRGFMQTFHGTEATAYNVADTPMSGDLRIQNITARADTVLANMEYVGTRLADTLIGGVESTSFTGLAGDDVIAPGAGADSVDGGEGVDTIDYSAAAGGVFIELGSSRPFVLESSTTTGTINPATVGSIVSTDTLVAIEVAFGSVFGDRFYGGTANNIFRPGGGADIAYGDAGVDTLDYLSAGGAAFVDLSSRFVIETSSTTGTVSGATPALSTDFVFEFENALLTAFGDRFFGDAGANRVALGAGNDIAYGGVGRDVLDYSAATGAIFADLFNREIGETALTSGTVSATTGRLSTDFVFEFEDLIATSFGDRIFASALTVSIDAGGGDDIVYGGASTTSILGGAGNDVLVAGAAGTVDGGLGNDLIYGSAGADMLAGGGGFDRFMFRASEGPFGADRITDFLAGDLIDLRGWGLSYAELLFSNPSQARRRSRRQHWAPTASRSTASSCRQRPPLSYSDPIRPAPADHMGPRAKPPLGLMHAFSPKCQARRPRCGPLPTNWTDRR